MSTSKKFIPNGDRDFVEMARRFAAALQRDPRTFAVDPEEAAAVERFEVALRAARGAGRRSVSKALTLRKAEARTEAETLIRRVAGMVRSNDRIAASDKAKLGITPRKRAGQAANETRRDAAAVLAESPYVRFEGAIHRAAHVPEHELSYRRSVGQPLPEGNAFGVVRRTGNPRRRGAGEAQGVGVRRALPAVVCEEPGGVAATVGRPADAGGLLGAVGGCAGQRRADE